MAKKSNHIWIANTSSGQYRMSCDYCKGETYIERPISLEMFLVMSEQFMKEHRDCQPPSTPSSEELL